MEKTTILRTVIFKNATIDDVKFLVNEYALRETNPGIGCRKWIEPFHKMVFLTYFEDYLGIEQTIELKIYEMKTDAIEPVGWIAKVEAEEGFLLGGVKVCESSVFPEYIDAVAWADVVIEGNKAAARKPRNGGIRMVAV